MGKQKPSPEYNSWSGMKDRCLNPNNHRWHRYGGRGISIDPSWLSFAQFLSDMGPRPSLRHSIERRDNDGNYEPGNCYWATPIQQQNNMRQNVRIEFEGKTQTIAQWARETGLNPGTIRARLRRKWALIDVFNLDTRHVPKRALPSRKSIRVCSVVDCGRLCANNLCARHRQARRAGRVLAAEIRPPAAKIGALDVLSIRAASSAGEYQKVLANRFGVSRPTISDIVRRRTWRDVE
jgi:hypothetical protein